MRWRARAPGEQTTAHANRLPRRRARRADERDSRRRIEPIDARCVSWSFRSRSHPSRERRSPFAPASLEGGARVSPGGSPSRETPRSSRASAHALALGVGPLDRANHALPHGRAVETASLGAGAVTAWKGMLPGARGRGDEHGIRGRTDGAEDTENQHSDRQFAARHAPDALLAKGTTVTLSESRALHEWPIESASRRANKCEKGTHQLVVVL